MLQGERRVARQILTQENVPVWNQVSTIFFLNLEKLVCGLNLTNVSFDF